MIERCLWRSTTTLFIFCLWLVKYLKNLKIIDLLITSRNVTFFLISSMTSQIFSINFKLGFLISVVFTTRDFALDILKSFDRVWYTGILYKPRFYGQMEYLFLFHLLLINVRLPAVLNGRSLQDNVICLPDNVICNIAVYADDTTLYTKGE